MFNPDFEENITYNLSNILDNNAILKDLIEYRYAYGNFDIIDLDNSENEIQAYLVALGEGGTIKANNADSPLLVRGGIAVSELEPDNLPKAGGYMVYNLAFDPVGDNFLKYFGIAIGPVGGEL